MGPGAPFVSSQLEFKKHYVVVAVAVAVAVAAAAVLLLVLLLLVLVLLLLLLLLLLLMGRFFKNCTFFLTRTVWAWCSLNALNWLGGVWATTNF